MKHYKAEQIEKREREKNGLRLIGTEEINASVFENRGPGVEPVELKRNENREFH